MQIDIAGDLNPGTWFQMEDSDAEVCVRICAGDDFRQIRKQTTKKRVTYKNGQRFQYEDVDEDSQTELMWDFCITDWKGFFDKDGAPIPCNKEMKKLLMGKSVAFSAFITKCLSKLSEVIETDAEAEEKNS